MTGQPRRPVLHLTSAVTPAPTHRPRRTGEGLVTGQPRFPMPHPTAEDLPTPITTGVEPRRVP